MKLISKNIRTLRLKEKMSQEYFADELKISRSRLAAYEEDRAEPGIEMLVHFSDYFKIPIDALVRVDLNKTDVNGMMKIGDYRMLLPIQVDVGGRDVVEVVTAKASAGYLNGYADPEFIEKLPGMKLPFQVTGKNRAFPIRGNSMPPADTGDFVIGKYVESAADIKNGNTYVLITKNDGIVYKRLYSKGSGNSSVLELHSDNKEYEMYSVKATEVIELWEYVCLLRMSNHKAEEMKLDSMISFLRSLKVEMKK